MNLLTQETCPRVDDTRLIPLTKNLFAKISACDYERYCWWSWRAQWNPCTQSFYAYRSEYLGKIDGKYKSLAISMARDILGLTIDDPRQADHINHDTLDNTRSNLRPATRAESMRNQRGKRGGVSAYKGVGWQRYWRNPEIGKWYATITVDRQRKFLGYFSTEEEAHDAYVVAALDLHGEFACVEGSWQPKL